MARAADFNVIDDQGRPTAVLTGDWTAVHMGEAPDRLATALSGAREAAFDLTGVDRCDTSGAWGVLRAAGGTLGDDRLAASPEVKRLLALVAEAGKREPPPLPREPSVRQLFERIGHGVVDAGVAVFETLVFNGHLLVATGRAIRDPRRIRWASVFSLAERAGLDAIPIVAITTFFIGAVVGLLGANLLAQFGAQVFAVELIGISVLREFNALITALLLAGRSASSFAAEIGSMKMNQEIDAMRVLGVDPFDALVFPRFLALLMTVPLLTFVATLAGLFGGMIVAVTALGLTPTAFITRLLANVGVIHFWVGLSKAPIFAVVIAGIGCRQGLAVGGDVESLGRRVTAAVVHAIFAAILIDALFALIYMKLNV
ncbi:MAG: MlaE family lipid ABC transporter permease subunit [Caulobacteraceae bacterium]|nr:MlaE family lipid ABC transporter permease subunit [Caulobacteraceae bacterium]